VRRDDRLQIEEEMMQSRRNFMLATTAILAAPYVVRNRAAAATPIVRRDVMDMQPSDRFFSDYAKAVQQMHSLSGNDGRSWLAQAKTHADYCHHHELQFLHWHRPYIRFFEQICAKFSGNPDFALPYWNWSKNSGRIPAPFFDLPELNVEHWNDPGQYVGKAWGPINTIGRRGLDKNRGLLDTPGGGAFTLTNINRIKGLPNIDLFVPGLERQPHDTGHIITGALQSPPMGHMYSGLSPLDPIFWLHHCMADRVWAEWQQGHTTPDPKVDYSGQFVDADGKPAQANSTMALNIANLGYTYDVLQTVSVAAVAAARSQPVPLKTIASITNNNISRVNEETAIEVAIPSLTNKATELRVQAAASRPSSTQILAKLSDITAPETTDLVVNVFVNCPYLSPATPYTDPHFAGTFSFFGAAKMAGMGGDTCVVDITTAVREAQFAPDKINLQFMPVPAIAGGESRSTFKVGKVEILST
jgi:tyrosinase